MSRPARSQPKVGASAESSVPATSNPASTCKMLRRDQRSIHGATMSAVVTVDIDTSVGTDGQYAYHAPLGAYSFVRARIGTDVTVAFLSVVLVAN